MKLASRSLFLSLLCAGVLSAAAQSAGGSRGQSPKVLKKVLELKIPREGGANGASVAWHPVLKKYYASMAGNANFFLGVYDTKGKLLNPVSQEALFDVRGLWYNTNTKTIQMNGYNDFGWAEYKLDSKGFPTRIKILHEGMNQPDEQSTGAFNPKEKVVYFFNEDGGLDKYDLADGEYMESVDLQLGKTSGDEDDYSDNYEVMEDYNNTTVVFTGIPKSEIGLVNHFNREIELYDLKTGYVTRKYSFPDEAPIEEFLNFSYSNGIFWLFDKKKRIWIGYK